MPYIGRDLNRGNYLKLDDISSSFNGSTQTFNLTVGGSAFTPGSAFSILVSVGGVIQEPESAYQVNNSEITFANAPTAQDGFFCIALGVALGIGVPGSGTVNGPQMAKPFNYDGYFYLNDGTNRVGINSSIPSETLDIVGNTKISGIITATKFSGPVVGNTNNASGISTFYDLRVTNNLTVEGTTTTLDTNLIGVDRIEVGANSNTIVGVAITQSGSAHGLSVDGTTVLGKTVNLPTFSAATQLAVANLSGNNNFVDLSILGGRTGRSMVKFGDHDNKETGSIQYHHSDDSLRFFNNASSTEKLVITGIGSVGIGTDSPKQQLEVFSGSAGRPTFRHTGGFGGVQIAGPQNASGASVMFTRGYDVVGGGTTTYSIHMAGNTQGFHFVSGDPSEYQTKTRLFLGSTGKVGIGTLTPQEDLTIMGATPALMLRDSDQTGSYTQVSNANQDMYFSANGASAHANFIFRSGNNGSFEERVRIKSDGNVGIGTHTPDGKTHIHESSAGSVTAATDANNLVIESSTNVGMSLLTANDSLARIKFGDPDANNAGAFVYNHQNDKLSIVTGTGNRMIIGSDMISARTHYGVARTVGGYTFRETNEGNERAGMHSNASNELIFKTGGAVEQLRIDGSGNVGVGTNDPKVSGLHVDGDIFAGTPYISSGLQYGGIRLESNNSGAQAGGVIYGGHHADSNHSIFFRRGYDGANDTLDINEYGMFRIFTGGAIASQTERLRITSSGVVGINTTVTAATQLQVQSDGTSTTAGGNVVARFQSFGSGKDATIQLSDNVAHSATISMLSSALIFKQSGTETLRIDSNGKVGIGTDALDANLTIHADAANQTAFTIHADMGTNNNRTLNIKTPVTDNDSHPFVIQTANALSVQIDTTERFRVHSNGAVGINSTSPVAYIDVEGSGTLAKFGITDNGNSNYETLFIKNNVAGYPAITNESSPDTIELRSAGSVQATIDYNNNDTNKYFRVMTNGQSADGTELFRVQENGKVGIGSASPAKKLQINTTGNSGEGILLKANDNTYPAFIGDANRDNEDLFLVALQGYWNGTRVGEVTVESGSDTDNKDEGMVKIRTRTDGETSPQDRFTVHHTGQVEVHSTTQSTLTTNGALRVNGGIGVAKNIICGGNLEVQNSDLIVTSGTPNILMAVPSGGLDSRIYNDGSGNFIIGHGTNSSAPTERITISSSGQIKHTSSSGNTIFTMQRTNTNTTGAVGTINFAASDDHSVASIVTIGDGNNEGAHITFRTTTAAASDDPYDSSIVERLRITSDGNVDVMNGGELGITTNTNNTSVLNFKNNVKDHKLGGVCVQLSDDTISDDIMLPGARHGCLLFMFAHSDANGTYPQPGPCGMVYVDVGASPNIRAMYTQGGTGPDATTTVGGSMVGKSSHETDINNCDDGKVTIMKGSANGRIKLANRLDATYYFYLTMM